MLLLLVGLPFNSDSLSGLLICFCSFDFRVLYLKKIILSKICISYWFDIIIIIIIMIIIIIISIINTFFKLLICKRLDFVHIKNKVDNVSLTEATGLNITSRLHKSTLPMYVCIWRFTTQ